LVFGLADLRLFLRFMAAAPLDGWPRAYDRQEMPVGVGWLQMKA